MTIDNNGRLTVALVGDAAARASLSTSLGGAADIRVVVGPDNGKSMPAADVVIVDICSTGTAGYTIIETLMRSAPVPILAVTPASGAESERRALRAGAIDVVVRSARGSVDGALLRRRVRLVSGVAVVRRVAAATEPAAPAGQPRRIVAIGASTGGPAAVAAVLSGLSGLTASVLIVQHLHEDFMAGFIEWLDKVSPLPVSLAVAGVTAEPGHVYVAPAGRHLLLGGNGTLTLSADPPGLHIPAIDVLFQSVAVSAAGGAVGVLLTGMGSDGAAGLLAMRAVGAVTIAQDEATSAVYGMPKVAVEMGAVSVTLPLQSIAATVMRRTRRVRA